MIPISDENPSQNRPYVVYGLIILNILVYAIDSLGAHGPISGLWNYSMIPKSVITNQPVTITYAIPGILNGMLVHMQREVVHQGLNPEWLTIFTSMFMHASLLHIGGNMLYLWIFGNNIEDMLGHAKFFFFYMACGVLAALAQIYSAPESTVPTVGASGAIAGVLGAYILVYPTANIRTLIPLGWFMYFAEVPAVFVLGVWFLIQLTGVWGAGGMQGGGVAYWAHVGGFIAGIVLILILGGKSISAQRRRRNYRPPDNGRPYPFRPWR